MALLAEEIVEEWLNRQGYFTIRGIKMGVQEIDLLAVKWRMDGKAECRHIEVQASMRPVSYISRVPKEEQKAGRAANSAKRSDEELPNYRGQLRIIIYSIRFPEIKRTANENQAGLFVSCPAAVAFEPPALLTPDMETCWPPADTTPAPGC